MKRHALSTRLWHWVNALSLIVLFMSELNISNAHRYLYWGEWGFAPDQAWLHVWRFPGWATIPGYYSLAAARDWHVLFAWVFALSLLLFMLAALLNGHFRRDIVTGWRDWRPGAVWRDIRAHLRASGLPDDGTKLVSFHDLVTPDSEGLIEVAVTYDGTTEPIDDLYIRLVPEHTEAFLPVPREYEELPLILRVYDALEAWTDARPGVMCTGHPYEIYPGTGARFDVAYPVVS